MLVYLLKSTACMAVFLLFYKLLLEKENMHQFKRIYLLGVLVASLMIPNLVFIEYVEPTIADTVVSSIAIDPEIIAQSSVQNIDTINLPFLVWSIYLVGLVAFSFRFFRNLFQIVRRILNNPKFKGNSIINVLLQENIVPHTFFNFIFLNKSKYESNTIPKEVLLHEETHAKQRHSFDVLFVELLQLLLWFNPLIYFIKKSIKLNHEFLADRAVIENGVASSSYQHTLLSYMTPHHHQSLASAINYSSIKKRFTIMKTHTSKKAVFLRSLLLLPLLSLLIYGFSETNIVQVQADSTQHTEKEISPETISLKTKKLTLENTASKQKGASRKLMAEYNKLAKHYNEMSSSNMRIKMKDIDRLTYIYGLMSDKQKADAESFPNFPPMPEPPLPPKPLKAPKPAKVLKAPKPVKAIKGVKSDIPPPPAPRVLKGEISDIPPPPNAPEEPQNLVQLMIEEQDPYDITVTRNKQVQNVVFLKNGNMPIGQQLPLSQPTSGLDHIIDKAKKNAIFYYEGKEITSEMAIELVKKNDELNIDSRSSNKKQPVVKISTSPIRVKN